MNQERTLKEMIDELHELVAKLPLPPTQKKAPTFAQSLVDLGLAVNRIGMKLQEDLNEVFIRIGPFVSFNGGGSFIDTRSRWQKIKDKVLRR